MTNQTTSTILNSAIANSQELLTKYTLGDELLRDFTTAFGSQHDRHAASELITQWQTGDFGSFPEIEIRSAEEINGANGAYSADTNKIYIAEEYLLANTNNIKAITDLVLEEYGHFVDTSINSVDSAGDEGAIFSGLVQGESFTDSELQQLQLENDQAVITLDGEEIAIEQREASVTPLPENFKIKGDRTNLHIGDFDGDGRDDFIRESKVSNGFHIFSSSSSENNISFRRISAPLGFLLSLDDTNLHIGDFNGDGKDDILRQENDKRAALIFRPSFVGDQANFTIQTIAENFSLKGDETNLHVGDFNGDGRDDILRQEKGRLDNDNSRTVDILFADSNGGFSANNRVTLPENFDLKGDLTNLHVGDFNGDGKDDFIRQGRRDSGINDRIFFSNGDGSFSETFLPSSILNSTGSTTISDVGDFNGDGKDDLLIQKSVKIFGNNFVPEHTSIFFSNGNGSFSEDRLFSSFLGEDLEGFIISKSLTNLHIGDFNGDGSNDLLRQEKNSLDDDNLDTAQIFSDIGFTINGGSGNDTLNGDSGNDTLLGGDGNDLLLGEDGNDSLDGGDGNDLLLGGDNNDSLDGGDGNDLLLGGDNNDFLDGGDGNDSLDGGEGNNFLFGGKGDDTLNGGPDGNDTLGGGEGDDLIDGGNRKDIIRGDAGNDTLLGGRNTDTLEGGAGNDILNGGNGDDLASYQGDIGGFDVTVNDDGSITVTDIDLSNGDEGTDTLTNISQLAFGGSSRLGADNDRNTVLGIAGVHQSTDNTDTSSSIIGGKAAATNFVIDIEGTTGLGLDFDTTKLASFINDITLPDQDIENARLAANLGFDLAAGGAGLLSAFPVIGAIGTAAATTGIAMAQTLSNYAFDLAQVQAQRQAATDAVNNTEYDTSVWGTITETNRDIVEIKDFQIGVDNVFLPSVSDIPGVNVGYAISAGTSPVTGRLGVNIQAQIGSNEISNLVFIENNYGSLNNTEFLDQITNLLVSGEGTGSIIGTFNQTPVRVEPLQGEQEEQLGSFAGDRIIGLELGREPDNSESGSFEFIGRFGDDLIQGASQDDLLYGGFNSDRSLTDGALTYEDDGFDILQGGKGDDLLNGGSGNDVLDGGGFIYDDNLNITGVIVDDGTDTLIGGSGNDTFVFNTPDTGIDVIRDFTVLVDKIQINQANFGATGISDFSFDQTNGVLSFNSQQFATLENFAELQDFDVNRDIQLV